MLRARHFLGLLVTVPLLAFVACGDDEDVKQASGSDAGNDSGNDSNVDAGDKGLFGERVPITETRQIANLTGPVNAVRDKYGWVHIYARNTEDALRVQGYMMAVDRAGQLELLRRAATGRLAEVLGGASEDLIDDDISMRTVGLRRFAEEYYNALPAGEIKSYVDAFSDGVTQWNKAFREGTVEMPQNLLGYKKEHFTDWSPIDSLALAKLQTMELSYDADADISRTERVEKVKAVFNPTATDPLAQKRAGLLLDVFRFAPPVTATPLDGFPGPAAYKLSAKATPVDLLGYGVKAPKQKLAGVPLSVLEGAKPFLRALERVRNLFTGDEFFGSNNWAVAGSHTTSGNAMVANDPHLGLTSPMTFWPTHLVVQADDAAPPELEVIGIQFPGIPGVVLGSNRTLAWGATTAGYDVTDVYAETVDAGGTGVMFKGSLVPFQTISETMQIAGQPDYTFDVRVVPHHGPLVPEIVDHKVVAPTAAGALSVRWTGHGPTGEFEAVTNLLRAKNVDEGNTALQPFASGAQNWMMADSEGEIMLLSQAKIPYRDKAAYTWSPATFSGTNPCFVLDGESGNMEWTGEYLEQQYVPQLKTPAKGWIATANTDHIGSSNDNDPTNELLPNGNPFYIGCDFADGFRLGRIHERLEAAVGSMTVDEMASIQADHKSGLGARLAKYLITALEAAEEEKTTAGAHPDLTPVVADPRYAAADVPEIIATLKKWETEGAYEAAAGINLDDDSLDVPTAEADASRATLVFNAWLVRALARAFEDEWTAAGISNLGSTVTVAGFIHLLETTPATLATYDAPTADSALWDDMATPAIESRNNRFAIALLDAVDDIEGLISADRNAWRWGRLHRIRFDSLVPTWLVPIPGPADPIFYGKGFPRHGDQWNVDACNFGLLRSLSSELNFNYGSGPVQRFVAELTPSGPKIKNALPGGVVLSSSSPYFKNEAELWRKNESHDVPFDIDDVAAAVEAGGQHILFTP
jgi:penicillin amidase